MKTQEVGHHELRSYKVSGMTCASCAISIETYLGADERIREAHVNYPNQSVLLCFDESEISEEEIAKLVHQLGYHLVIDKNPEQSFEKIESDRQRNLLRKLWVAIIFSIPVFVLSMFFMNAFSGQNWVLLALSLPVMAYSGSEFYVNAWKLAKRFKTNMDTLVALSTSVAFVFSAFITAFPHAMGHGLHGHVYFESAVVIISLILLGRFLEERAKGRASSVIRGLMGLRPQQVTVIRNGEEIEIPMEDLILYDLVLVKPGARIPADGRVRKGESYVDESMITGEPVPQLRKKGDAVFAGTTNQKGSLQILVEKTDAQTLLSKVISLVEQAQASKPAVQKQVDRIAAIFVPTIVVLSIITFAIWMIFGGQDAFPQALVSSITVLIIACPCALGLATPTALMVGLGRGATRGILIRNAQVLELMHRVNAIVLDKTGTITEGHPKVQASWLKDENQNELGVLLSMEKQSEHPIADALVRHLDQSGILPKKIDPIQSITGKGAIAQFNEGNFFVGSRAFMEEHGLSFEPELSDFENSENHLGRSLIFFASTEILAAFSISDTVKSDATEAIRNLKAQGLEVHLLTGDSAANAEAVAREVGIENVKSGVLPEDKLLYVEALQKSGKTVAMAGDGINDAAALAKADVGIAMGTGTDIAMESADLTLMNSRISTIAEAIRLSEATLSTIRANLFWAFIYNLLAIPVAAGILYPFFGYMLDPMLAGLAMSLSSISVVLNSLRLRNK